jgi:beta-xylosidase
MKFFGWLIIFIGLTQWTLAGNPIFRAADPHAVLADGTVYVYPTAGGRGRFYAYSSADLLTWQRHEEAILNFRNIDWIPRGKSAWAPAIIEKDGTWFFYYSVGPKPSHIGVASGPSPVGPFTDSGKALLSDNNDPAFEAIDPMVFGDPKSGKFYCYVGGSAGATLRVFEMADNMLTFAREVTVDTPRRFTEGAFMHERNGTYYLSYSHGGWRDASYSVHYATSETATGPWTYQGAILTSDETYKGPGHHSFVHDPVADAWYIFYHRWENVTGDGPYSGSRVTAIETVQYDAEGRILPITMTQKGVGPVALKSDRQNPDPQ